MSSLSDFVTVNITTTTATPSQIGFGTPLVLAYLTAWPDQIRTYRSLTAMAADGINPTGVGAACYWTAAAIFSQNPRVDQIKVGRRSNAWTQIVKLIPTTTTAGLIYRWSIGVLGGASVSFTYTVPGGATIASIITAMKALIDGTVFVGLTMTTLSADGNTTLQCTTGTAGCMFVYSGRNKELEILESTAAPAAITTDLDTIRVLDDDWYGIVLDSSSKAESALVAAWCEPQLKIFFNTTADSENGKVGVSGTILKVLKTANYFRTSTWFDGAALPSFLGAGIMGEEFPFAPGSGTYLGKTVRGVNTDNTVSATNEAEILAQNGNVYTSVAGLSVTRPGKSAAGEFIDIAVGRDWLQARIKERVFGLIAGARKVPYTDAGVSLVKAEVKAQLQEGVKSGYLAASPEPLVTAPLVKDISSANKANRILPDVNFSATLAGAIHAVQPISGTISV